MSSAVMRVTWSFEVTRPSADCQTTFFWDVSSQFEKHFEKVAERSRDSGRQVTRPSADCQTTFFGRLEAIWEIFWKNIAERSRDSGRRSRDSRPTVKQRFLDVSSDLGKFWKKSLNGHATVVEVTRPSADCQTTFFGRFKRFGKYFEKSRWTVTRQWSEVTRQSADCQTTFFRRFKRFGENFEKSRWTVTRQWLRSRDRRPIVKQRFLDVSSDLGKFWKKSLNGHATVVEVTRPSADCQTTIFRRFKRIRNIFWKKSLNVHATVVGGHATVGRLSNNVFWTFQAIWENFEKSRWTVTRQWLGSRRPSADCQTMFFGRFKQFGIFVFEIK